MSPAQKSSVSSAKNGSRDQVDIEDAFGSIRLEKLRSILDRMTSAFIPQDRQIKKCFFGKQDETTGYFRTYEEYQFNGEPLTQPRGYFPYKEPVIVDARRILEHINRCIWDMGVKFGKRTYAVSRGVGQGLKIASAASEIYYRDMFECHLAEFMGPKSGRLFRLTDDILFLTTDRDRAERFLSIVEAGFQEYNCTMNRAKTRTNLDRNTNCVHFYGTEICVETFSLTPLLNPIKNYAIFHKYDPKTKQQKALKTKEVLNKCRTLGGAKIAPWFLDLRINGKKKVLKNILISSKQLAEKLFYTRLHCRDNFNQKSIRRTIRRYTRSIVKSCRKIFETRCPSLGKNVSDAEITLQTYKGALLVFRDSNDYKRITRVIRNAIKNLTVKFGA